MEAGEKKYFCVEYPALVQNEAKAITSLRGIDIISKTYANPSKRLELYHRPQDLYCKPAVADRTSTTNLLLKVKRKKTKRPDGKDEIETKLEGIVDVTYKFRGIADFQYLPLHTDVATGQHSSVSESILTKMEDPSWLDKNVDLFLPPASFSRMDMPSDYYFKPEVKHKDSYKDPTNTMSDNFIGPSRQRRPHYTIFRSYNDQKKVPESIPVEIQEILHRKLKDGEKSEKRLRQLFEERPIWSKNAIRFQAPEILEDHYKFLLPLMSYHIMYGPWRGLWIKFGYDPNEHKEAKIYQTVDVRVKSREMIRHYNLTAKRSLYDYQRHLSVHKSRILPPMIGNLANQSKRVNTKYQESVFKFKPGFVPPYRQMFYQACDIEEEQIQKLLHSNDGMEPEKPREKDGWCMAGFCNKAREIIQEHLRKGLPPKFSEAGGDSSNPPSESTSPKPGPSSPKDDVEDLNDDIDDDDNDESDSDNEVDQIINEELQSKNKPNPEEMDNENSQENLDTSTVLNRRDTETMKLDMGDLDINERDEQIKQLTMTEDSSMSMDINEDTINEENLNEDSITEETPNDNKNDDPSNAIKDTEDAIEDVSDMNDMETEILEHL
ncbi:unnamed protein product [Owenia fusiformis]|uniref:Uncharacterized protein n=1 Tax=Owenia fusiformis TaxID=6347 RepID=A0A8J1TZP5_OWEFU|nr:unnamed protein product [Owenia fusiformis]